MKTKRKFLSILLSVCMTLTLTPLTASAADSHNFVITKDGVCIEVTDENSADILEDGGSVSYDKVTNTLTLNNCNFTADSGKTYYDIGIYKSASELNIKLVGDNTVSGDINASNGLKISGEGTLNVIEVRPFSGELLIDGCTINAEAIKGDSVKIINGATVIATQKGYDFGIHALNNLYVEGSKVTGISESDMEFAGIYIQNGSAEIKNSTLIASSKMDRGIVAENGSLTIVNSDVKATSEAREEGVPAIYAMNDFSISDNSEVIANAVSGNAVYADNQLTVDSSVLNAAAQEDYPAIYASGDIDVKNESEVEGSGKFRGIYTDSDMTVTDSTVTATGTTDEGMVVVGTLTLNNSSLTASSKPNDIIPAIVTKNFNITNSEVTAKGGFDLFDWYNGNIDDISFSIAPANGKLAEFKVDGNNWDGSAAKHFKEGNESPYDTAINFSADEMNWLGAYRYIHIGEHIHAGGTATCTEFAVCEDCGRGYGAKDSSNHDFQNGICTRCGEKDPNYIPPPVVTYYDITAEQSEHGSIKLSTDRIHRYGDVDVTLTAEEGYEVKDLLINGKSVGAVSSYTIEDVSEDIHVTAVFGETEEAKNDRIAKGVQNTTIRMYYKKNEIGKGWIKLHYKKSYGYKVDNYEIFRSAKKKTGFGDKPYFVTKKNNTSGFYKNTKNVKKGTRYFYKMRGVREIAGETYYTQWSNVVMRTGR